MELWDILDEKGIKTGRTILRGQPFQDGEFMLAVHIYIYNSKNEFLIQKRSMNKQSWPGCWDCTGGAVISGEDSANAAIREVYEELGIIIEPFELEYISRLRRNHHIVDIWAVQKDVEISQCVLQEEEVDEIKYVSAKDLISILFDNKYCDEEYKNVILNVINK